MKKVLLDGNKSYFKANLHCHSVNSDGTKTPEELKEMYKQHGYSVLAYTDHDILLDRSYLCDDEFLALNGYEMEANDTKSDAGKPQERKCCHMCFIALEQDNLTQVCYHRNKYLFGNAPEYRHLIKFDETKEDFVREYTPECINKMFEEGRKNGFFVTYNHPSWSLENLDNYGKYEGMNAMEICNYGCLEAGFCDYNEKEYDDILRKSRKIFCIATDDNHNKRNDSFGGFTMINADCLAYRTITTALENGCFYASQGPEIYELWYEEGKIGIKCSDASKIILNTGVRRTDAVYAEEKNGVKEAVFDIQKEYIYVRITVTDFSGRHANTNAYFMEDLMKNETV